jgi:hypothetical protein
MVKTNGNIDNKKKTMEDKLKELDIPKKEWSVFTNSAVDIMYEKVKYMIDITNMKEQRLLYFLNEMLDELGHDKIEKVDNFKIFRSDILQLDSGKFVEERRLRMENYGINVNNNLYYHLRNNNKSYGLTILKGLSKYYGFCVKSKEKNKQVDGKRQISRYYVLKKNK